MDRLDILVYFVIEGEPSVSASVKGFDLRHQPLLLPASWWPWPSINSWYQQVWGNGRPGSFLIVPFACRPEIDPCLAGHAFSGGSQCTIKFEWDINMNYWTIRKKGWEDLVPLLLVLQSCNVIVSHGTISDNELRKKSETTVLVICRFHTHITQLHN